MSDLQKTIGQRLADARIYIGLSQEQVAQHMHLPLDTIGQIESGERAMNDFELRRFAKLYQRPPNYFTTEQQEGIPVQVQALLQAAPDLSDHDRSEVAKFASFLQGRVKS